MVGLKPLASFSYRVGHISLYARSSLVRPGVQSGPDLSYDRQTLFNRQRTLIAAYSLCNRTNPENISSTPSVIPESSAYTHFLHIANPADSLLRLSYAGSRRRINLCPLAAYALRVLLILFVMLRDVRGKWVIWIRRT